MVYQVIFTGKRAEAVCLGGGRVGGYVKRRITTKPDFVKSSDPSGGVSSFYCNSLNESGLKLFTIFSRSG